MTEKGSIKEDIRKYVVDSAQSRGVNIASDDESLLSSGVVDSLGIFRLVSFLEETFSLRVSDDEIVYENFKSINEIERFVTRKSQGSDTKA